MDYITPASFPYGTKGYVSDKKYEAVETVVKMTVASMVGYVVAAPLMRACTLRITQYEHRRLRHFLPPFSSPSLPYSSSFSALLAMFEAAGGGRRVYTRGLGILILFAPLRCLYQYSAFQWFLQRPLLPSSVSSSPSISSIPSSPRTPNSPSTTTTTTTTTSSSNKVESSLMEMIVEKEKEEMNERVGMVKYMMGCVAVVTVGEAIIYPSRFIYIRIAGDLLPPLSTPLTRLHPSSIRYLFHVIRTEGVRSLYRGFVANWLAVSIPALSYALYSWNHLLHHHHQHHSINGTHSTSPSSIPSNAEVLTGYATWVGSKADDLIDKTWPPFILLPHSTRPSSSVASTPTSSSNPSTISTSSSSSSSSSTTFPWMWMCASLVCYPFIVLHTCAAVYGHNPLLPLSSSTSPDMSSIKWREWSGYRKTMLRWMGYHSKNMLRFKLSTSPPTSSTPAPRDGWIGRVSKPVPVMMETLGAALVCRLTFSVVSSFSFLALFYPFHLYQSLYSSNGQEMDGEQFEDSINGSGLSSSSGDSQHVRAFEALSRKHLIDSQLYPNNPALHPNTPLSYTPTIDPILQPHLHPTLTEGASKNSLNSYEQFTPTESSALPIPSSPRLSYSNTSKLAVPSALTREDENGEEEEDDLLLKELGFLVVPKRDRSSSSTGTISGINNSNTGTTSHTMKGKRRLPALTHIETARASPDLFSNRITMSETHRKTDGDTKHSRTNANDSFDDEDDVRSLSSTTYTTHTTLEDPVRRQPNPHPSHTAPAYSSPAHSTHQDPDEEGDLLRTRPSSRMSWGHGSAIPKPLAWLQQDHRISIINAARPIAEDNLPILSKLKPWNQHPSLNQIPGDNEQNAL